jgi:hypothetical protein
VFAWRLGVGAAASACSTDSLGQPPIRSSASLIERVVWLPLRLRIAVVDLVHKVCDMSRRPGRMLHDARSQCYDSHHILSQCVPHLSTFQIGGSSRITQRKSQHSSPWHRQSVAASSQKSPIHLLVYPRIFSTNLDNLRLLVTSHERRKPLYQSEHTSAPWPSAACKKMGPGGTYRHALSRPVRVACRLMPGSMRRGTKVYRFSGTEVLKDPETCVIECAKDLQRLVIAYREMLMDNR